MFINTHSRCAGFVFQAPGCDRSLNVWPHVGGTSGHLTVFFPIHPKVLAASCRQIENLLLKQKREVSVR